MASFNWKIFLNKASLIVKGLVIVLFTIVWVFQANKAIGNKDRLESALESVNDVLKHSILK